MRKLILQFLPFIIANRVLSRVYEREGAVVARQQVL